MSTVDDLYPFLQSDDPDVRLMAYKQIAELRGQQFAEQVMDLMEGARTLDDYVAYLRRTNPR